MEWYPSILDMTSKDWSYTKCALTNKKLIMKNDSIASIDMNSDVFTTTPKCLKLTINYLDDNNYNKLQPTFKVRILLQYEHSYVQDINVFCQRTTRGTSGNYIDTTILNLSAKKLVTFTVEITAANITSDIIINSCSLQASVDVDQNVLDTIQQNLPSIMYYGNKDALSVAATSIVALYGSVALGGSSNLLVHLMICGTSTAACEVVVDLLLDNVPLDYSPVQHAINAGHFTLGLPFSLLQLKTGAHYLSVNLKATNNATLSIPAKNIQLTIDGRNILGGLVSEPPHAEATEEIEYHSYSLKDLHPTTSVSTALIEYIANSNVMNYQYKPISLSDLNVRLAAGSYVE